MADSEGNSPSEGNIVYLWKIPIDKSYVKSLRSIFAVVAAFLSLIAFICCASGRSDNCDDSYASTYNYFEFVSMSAFLSLMVWWLFFALTLNTRLFFKLVPWPFADMIFCAVFVVLYLIANIVLAAQSCGKDNNKAATAFGFFAMFFIAADAFLAFREWHGSRGQASADTSNKSPEYNAERNMEQY